ncbi:hypothetical protein GCM10018980_20280 [Streptomyces capoamus]|uniref:Transposase n=1 Tax=Streptomyces capoamus TaxID=68183 RepID=A0A919EW66_9ACTN|nr:hypothetical protein GCM10010501_33870 [Streptomyces libani subsp. rufus]GHG43357.1 hypothetical protein GCM10018980_20280 [Streptomyces capoamus]
MGRAGPGRPRTKPDSLAADKGYSNTPCRIYLRRRGIRHVILEKVDSQAARLRRRAVQEAEHRGAGDQQAQAVPGCGYPL